MIVQRAIGTEPTRPSSAIISFGSVGSVLSCGVSFAPSRTHRELAAEFIQRQDLR